MEVKEGILLNDVELHKYEEDGSKEYFKTVLKDTKVTVLIYDTISSFLGEKYYDVSIDDYHGKINANYVKLM